jgi:glycosyltransferase involved in cell wall biosynthesis
MKILQVCNKIPYPSKDGGSMAMHQLSESLSKLGQEVKVLAMNTSKQNFDPAVLPADYRQRFKPEYVFMDTRVKALDALLNLFSDKSYNIERFNSTEFEHTLQRILQAGKYDIIHLESLYVAPYLPVIRKYSQAKVVYRAHNIEHLIWDGLARKEKNPLRKKYLQLRADRLKAYEKDKINAFDGIAAITPGDAAYFRREGCTKPVVHIPFGIAVEPLVAAESDPNAFFFIGAMDWLPNQESIRWVLDTLWPRIFEKHPNARLYIAGRNKPRWLVQYKAPGVEVQGEVEDATAFMSNKAILLAPYFSGSGMRVKFIEAMAQKKVIVTTALGAEGIEGRDGEHFLLAETESGMISVIDRFMRQPELREVIGSKARSLMADKYDWRRIAIRLVDLYLKIC